MTLPKHDKIRTVPMTARLTQALLEHRHLQGPRVLYRDGMAKFSRHTPTREERERIPTRFEADAPTRQFAQQFCHVFGGHSTVPH